MIIENLIEIIDFIFLFKWKRRKKSREHNFEEINVNVSGAVYPSTLLCIMCAKGSVLPLEVYYSRIYHQHSKSR